MEIIVYWDSLFLLNFIMNYWILRVLQYRFTLVNNRWRLVLAAIVGAGLYLGLLILDTGNFLGQVLEIILSTSSMVILILPKERRRLFGKVIGYGLFCAFFTAGLLKTIYAKLHILNRSGIHILGVLTIGFIATEGVRRYLQQKRNEKKRSLFQVQLKSEKETVTVTALLDTGNSLKEPISQKPVCLLEAGILHRLIDTGSAMFRVVPYCSVGCEQGLLYAYVLPEVLIQCGDQNLVLKDVFCAEVTHKLSAKHHYEMILHPSCVEEI